MKYEYDLIVIGLGPAGMAVSIMASEMGLKVCAIEKHKVGGECMNVGCIPSKSLLRMAKWRSVFDKLDKIELEHCPKPAVKNPFGRIQKHLDFISEKKTMKMFDKVTMVYQRGSASFVDSHTVEVGVRKYTAKRIYVCVGTRPAVPDFAGLENVDYLTNENIFSLEAVPGSLLITGGGAIACEMAQAFARLGSKVTMVIRGPRLIWREDFEATDEVEKALMADGVDIVREQRPAEFSKVGEKVVLKTDRGTEIVAEKVLVAAGRKLDFAEMRLQNAGVEIDDKGAIKVNKYLQTSCRHIYAAGDCNNNALFSHAAMHQGMIALMNSMAPWPFKKGFKNYVVPWTVFTEPAFSHVGMNETQLKEKGKKYDVVKANYADYGAAIAENVGVGFVKAFISPMGKIYGVYVVGEGSGDMINEWGLAIQKKIKIYDIMMLQHSFPSMSFLNKRVGEGWMMQKMKNKTLQKICQFMFRM